LGIKLPAYLRQDRFDAGFLHALKGGHLTRAEYFRLSFRMGFRAAKLYLREVRRRQGILEFPFRGKMILRTVW
jgi:hypothetical protein